MYFSLINLPVIFQAMINNILRDLIDTGNIAALIDDMLVGTEQKRKYKEILEEILKRIEENDLYIKLEKYIWKVKEMDFFGLVIEAKGIKIQDKRVIEVLEWPKPKMVKDVQKFLGLANYYR